MAAPLKLSSLPLFPLHSVLFPGGTLHLQIFEVRYLDLIGKCIKTGAPFGVVSLVEGREVRQRSSAVGDGFAPERFADVGTLATVAEWESPQAGLMKVRCTGGERFRISRHSQLKHGLWVADVDGLAPDTGVPIPEDLQVIADALDTVLQGLKDQDLPPAQMPVQPPYQLQDCGWVANRWCDLLTLPPALKQSLMQLENPLLRLELVGDMLTKGGITP